MIRGNPRCEHPQKAEATRGNHSDGSLDPRRLQRGSGRWQIISVGVENILDPGELSGLVRQIDELRLHTYKSRLMHIDRWLENSKAQSGNAPLRCRHRLRTNTLAPVATLTTRCHDVQPYTVVSTKNCTIAASRIPRRSLWRPRHATERFSLLHRLREHLSMPAEHPLIPLLYPSYTPLIPLLYPSYTPLIPLLYPSYTPLIPLLYPSYTPLIPLLYPSYTPLIPLLYPSYTPLIPLLYPSYTPLIPLLYPSYTPLIPLLYPAHAASPLVIPSVLAHFERKR